jgi:hypothetical protein
MQKGLDARSQGHCVRSDWAGRIMLVTLLILSEIVLAIIVLMCIVGIASTLWPDNFWSWLSWKLGSIRYFWFTHDGRIARKEMKEKRRGR